jgi:hypothetical protein
MKTTRNILLAFLTVTCLNAKAQNSGQTENPDSIENRIIEILKNQEFYYLKGTKSYNEEIKDRPYYDRLKMPLAANIKDNTVVLKFKKAEMSVSLLQNFKMNTEYIVYFFPPAGYAYSKSGLIWGNLLILEYAETNELRQLLNKYRFNYYWGDFDKIANDYHSLTVKPAITEEMRKYIVQANAMNEKKNYSSAMNLYTKVIETNPFAYPPAYSNLALIAAQTENYVFAMVNMKKYLLLAPEAEDARAAQDKIYEWELEVEK